MWGFSVLFKWTSSFQPTYYCMGRNGCLKLAWTSHPRRRFMRQIRQGNIYGGWLSEAEGQSVVITMHGTAVTEPWMTEDWTPAQGWHKPLAHHALCWWTCRRHRKCVNISWLQLHLQCRRSMKIHEGRGPSHLDPKNKTHANWHRETTNTHASIDDALAFGTCKWMASAQLMPPGVLVIKLDRTDVLEGKIQMRQQNFQTHELLTDYNNMRHQLRSLPVRRR